MKPRLTEDLKTPAFLIELPTLRRNIGHIAARAEQFGVKLRPHVKTHKTVEIARMHRSRKFRRGGGRDDAQQGIWPARQLNRAPVGRSHPPAEFCPAF